MPISNAQDVATVSGPLTFTPSNWDQPQMVTVTGVSDGIIGGGDRNATISHSTSSTDSNYRGLTGLGEVTVAVADANGVRVMPTELSVLEGGQVTYTVRLNRQPTGDVMITPTSDNPAVATVSGTLTFTTSNWNTLQRVAVVGINDNTVNISGRTTTISHSISGGGYDNIAIPDVTVTAIDGVRVTVTRLSIIEGGRGTYAVRLNHQPTGNVMITPTSDDPSVATVSGTLTFTISNWNRRQRVVVTAVDDNALNDPARSTTISHSVSGSGYDDIAVPDVTVTTIDLPVVSITRDTDRSTTNTAFFRLTTKTRPTFDLNVKVRVRLDSKKVRSQRLAVAAQTSAQPIGEGENTVTIPAGQTSVELMVGGVDGRKVTMAMVADAGYKVEGDPEAVLEPDVALSASAVSVSESGGIGRYTLALTLRPTEDVRVMPASSDETVATISGPLIFTTENWRTPQTVTVIGVNDDIDNSPHRTARVTHTISGGGYDGIDVDPVSITAVDDEVVAIAIRALEPSVIEGEPVQFQLTATPASAVDLVVAIAVADPDGILADTAPTEVMIPADQGMFVFELETHDDEVDELDATVTVTLEEPSDGNYTIAAAPDNSASIKVTDDDGLTRERREEGIKHALGTFGRAAGWDLAETIRDRSRNTAVQGAAFEITNLPGFGPSNVHRPRPLSMDLSELLERDTEIRVTFNPQVAQALPSASESSDKSPLVRAWIKASRTDVESDPFEDRTQEGEMVIGRFGVDVAYASGWLIGSAFSWHDGNIEFEDTDIKGGVGVDLLSINPYVSFTKGKLHLWGTIGGGIGDLSYEDSPTETPRTSTSSDLRMLTAAVGAEYAFGRLGPFDLKGRGEGMIVDLDAEGSPDPLIGYDDIGVTVYGARGEFKLGLPLHFDDNRTEFRPYVFTGLRQDGGLGNDLAMEYGGGFVLRTRSLVAEGTIRSQGGRDDDGVSLKGYSISLAYDRGNDRKGLVARVEQSAGPSDYDPYGTGALSSLSSSAAGTSTRLHLGYGIGWDKKLLRPFVEMDWREFQQSDFDIGLEYQYLGGSASLVYSDGDTSNLGFRFKKLF